MTWVQAAVSQFVQGTACYQRSIFLQPLLNKTLTECLFTLLLGLNKKNSLVREGASWKRHKLQIKSWHSNDFTQNSVLLFVKVTSKYKLATIFFFFFFLGLDVFPLINVLKRIWLTQKNRPKLLFFLPVMWALSIFCQDCTEKELAAFFVRLVAQIQYEWNVRWRPI